MAHRFRRIARVAFAIVVVAAGTACGRSAEAAAPAAARKLHTITGLDFPESVRYDPRQDVYFVSNMLGPGSLKDNNGYIARVPAGGMERVEVFVRGGANGVTLHAPKGMAIQGDTVWVADIDALRGFHRLTGAPVATIDLRPHGAVLVNDVATGPDGLRVTDTGIAMTAKGVLFPGGDKIFAIGPGRGVSVVAEGAELRKPNGITWDARQKRWIVVSFHPFRSQIYALAGRNEKQVLVHGPGRYDGVEMLPDGRMLVTCWSDSSLHLIGGGQDRRIVRELWQPADIGVDTKRQRVAIPLVLQGRVEVWEIPGDRE